MDEPGKRQAVVSGGADALVIKELDQGLQDPARLAALLQTGLLDSEQEPAFDRLTQLAQRTLHAPVAIVSLVDEDRQFFKSAVGLQEPWATQRQTPLSHSFCKHVVSSRRVLQVNDAPSHSLVCDNDAIKDLGVRAYLGAPLIDAEGFVLGSFAVIDVHPRDWTHEDRDIIFDFASLAMTEINLRATTARARRESLAARTAEAEHREVSARYERVVNSLHEVVFKVDTTGRSTFLNTAWTEITGISVGEALGQDLSRYVFPEDRPAWETLVQDMVKRHASPRRHEIRLSGKGNRVRWVDVLARASVDDQGTVIGAAGTLTDITDRRQALQDLERSEARFRSVVENLGEGLLLTDLDNTILYANGRMAEMAGHEAKEMVGRPAHVLLSSPDEHALMVKRTRLRREGHAEQYETRLRRSDNSLLWLEVHSTPYRQPDGEIVGSMSACIDITARKVAEEALANSMRFVQKITDAVPLVLYVYDLREKRNVYGNRETLSVIGYSPEQIQAMGPHFLRHIVHPEDLPLVETYQAGLMDLPDGETRSIEYRVRSGQGDWRWLCSRDAIFTRNEKGIPIQILGTAEDVTERRHREERLRKLAVELQRSNQALQDFASVASHDLQEPLRKIQAFGDRLQSRVGEGLTLEGRDYLDRMMSAAHRMQGLIQDLLTYSRVTTKGRPFVEVDLEVILREVLVDLEARLLRSAGEVHVLNAPLPTLMADPLQIRQLLQNLVGNALKFHRPGIPPCVLISSDIVIRPLETGEKGRFCRLTVQDNGIGFEEKYAEKVFEVFERLHGRQEYEGTGIGLAICRKIVERHGGGIRASGVLGEGARFEVEIPVVPLGDQQREVL